MNPAENPTPAAPNALLAELAELRAWKAAACFAIWNLVRRGWPDTHVAIVPDKPEDPLWNLAFGPAPELDGHMKIYAGTIRPIDESEKKRVVRLLRGTSKPMLEALQELGLPYPPSYVEEQIAGFCVWHPEPQMWASPKEVAS